MGTINDTQIKSLNDMIQEFKISFDDVMAIMFENGFTKASEITVDKYDRIFNYLKSLKGERYR